VKSISKNKAKTHILILVVCFLLTSVLLSAATGAKPTFKPYELKSKYEEMLFFDFDGDDLDDIIAIDEPNLLFFFQDSKHGFPKTPGLTYFLGARPSQLR